MACLRILMTQTLGGGARPMKIIAVVSQKGGAGKTTIATNLAVLAERAGYPTVLFDLDPQATAAKWGDKRAGTPPDVVAAQAVRLGRLLEEVSQLASKEAQPQLNQTASGHTY